MLKCKHYPDAAFCLYNDESVCFLEDNCDTVDVCPLDEYNQKRGKGLTAVAEALQDAIVFVRYNSAAPGHEGACGPESMCDGLCVEAARDSALILKLERALSTVRTCGGQ